MVVLFSLLCVTPFLQAADTAKSSHEQRVLDRFLGTWRSVYKVPKAELTSVERTGAADITYRRILGGHFVQGQGRHANKKIDLVICTYDVQRKCYRGWWFTSWGRKSEWSGKWDEATKTFTWTYVASSDQRFTEIARHRFLNDNTFEWDFVIKDGRGKVLFRAEGKTTRVNDSKK
jgi:hypothetical protein